MAAQLAALRAWTCPGMAPKLAALAQADRAWQAQAEMEIAAEQSDHHDQAVALVTGGAGRALFARQPPTAQAAVDAQVSLVANSFRSQLRQALELLAVVLAVSLVGLVAMTVTGLVLVRRWIVTPLGQLVEAVGTVRDGQLFHPMPELDSTELAELAGSVDAMRVEILDQLRDAVHSREALEQQGPMVLQLRDNLAADDVEVPPGLHVVARVEPAEGFLAGDFYDLQGLRRRAAGRGGGRRGRPRRPARRAGRADQAPDDARPGRSSPDDPAAALGWMARSAGRHRRPVRHRRGGDHRPAGRPAPGGQRRPPARAGDGGHGELVRIGPTGPLIGPFHASWTTVTSTWRPTPWWWPTPTA